MDATARPAVTRPSRIRIIQRGKPDRWMGVDAPGKAAGVVDDAKDAHVAPFAEHHELAQLMRQFARLSNTPLEFKVEDAS